MEEYLIKNIEDLFVDAEFIFQNQEYKACILYLADKENQYKVDTLNSILYTNDTEEFKISNIKAFDNFGISVLEEGL